MFKKVSLLVLAVLILSGIFTSTAFAKEKTAHACKGTPVIDGEIDEIWKDTETIEVTELIFGYDDDTVAAKASKGKARMLWDEQYLYVLGEVEDSFLNKNPLYIEQNDAHRVDSIEFFIDEDNLKAQAYDENDAQYRIDIGGVMTAGKNAKMDKFHAVVKRVEGGYIAEAAIPFTIPPTENKEIGFDIQINDDQGSGDRVAITTWNQQFGNAWKDASEFGTLKLVLDKSSIPAQGTKSSEKSTEKNASEAASAPNEKDTVAVSADNSAKSSFPLIIPVLAGCVLLFFLVFLIFKKKRSGK